MYLMYRRLKPAPERSIQSLDAGLKAGSTRTSTRAKVFKNHLIRVPRSSRLLARAGQYACDSPCPTLAKRRSERGTPDSSSLWRSRPRSLVVEKASSTREDPTSQSLPQPQVPG